MAWIYLVIAGLFEVGWAIGLKYSEGFTKFGASAATVGTVILGMILFKDPATVGRIACIGLIIAGIAGLKFLTPAA